MELSAVKYPGVIFLFRNKHFQSLFSDAILLKKRKMLLLGVIPFITRNAGQHSFYFTNAS